jgi:hypothetical protein
MNTLKEYFSYTMILECGIPSMVLEGTQNDWTELKNMYEYFKSILLETELKPWFKHFDIVLNFFIEMRNMQELGIINGTNNMKEMMKRIISYVPQGSGGDKIIGGWIRLFCPYNGKNKVIGGLSGEIECLNLDKKEPMEKDYNYYSWQNVMKKYYNAMGWNDISTSFITTPAKLIDYDETEYDVEFYSGFYNSHMNSNNEVCMNIGYMVREDQEKKKNKMKNEYIKEGVIETTKGYISIPKKLKDKIQNIMSVFDAYSASYL